MLCLPLRTFISSKVFVNLNNKKKEGGKERERERERNFKDD
jgi:hypothetical protein